MKEICVNVLERGNIQRCQRGKGKNYHKIILMFVCQIWCTHKGETQRFCIEEKECCTYIYMDL